MKTCIITSIRNQVCDLICGDKVAYGIDVEYMLFTGMGALKWEIMLGRKWEDKTIEDMENWIADAFYDMCLKVAAEKTKSSDTK